MYGMESGQRAGASFSYFFLYFKGPHSRELLFYSLFVLSLTIALSLSVLFDVTPSIQFKYLELTISSFIVLIMPVKDSPCPFLSFIL